MFENTTESFGKPWKYRYDLINKDISNDWREELPLLNPLINFSVAKIKNKIFIIGGYNGDEYTSNVYSYKINKNGRLTQYKSEISLPSIKNNIQAILVKNKIFLIGGYNGHEYNYYYYNCDIFIGTINNNGNIKKWDKSLSLPFSLYGSQVINIKDKINIIGGSYSMDILNHMSFFTLNENNIIKNYYIYKKYLCELVSNAQIIVFKNNILLLGGFNKNDEYVDTIQTSKINDEGEILYWHYGPRLPIKLGRFQAIILGNKIFILGGCTNNNEKLSTIYMSTINEDGTLNEFIEHSYLPQSLSDFKAIITDNRLYIIGGINRNKKISNKIYSTAII